MSPGAIAFIVLALPIAWQAQHQHGQPGVEKLGTVNFPTSCSDNARPAFGRAMALLHSFEYGPAIDSFTLAVKTDPGCAIAYWGIALSRWGNPFATGLKSAASLEAARSALIKAREIGAKTERERRLIDAAGQLVADFEKVDQRTRVLAYREAMKEVAAQFPDDPEAAAFYALSIASSQDPKDMTYSSLLEAGAILERLAPAQPDHPGFVHYIIHAYDAPPLASRGLEAARRYAKIAPSAPHALHMPSHTFTRLGYWHESIETNIASADAARRMNAPSEELHATDYEVYAYLQLAQDAAARKLLDGLPELRTRFATSTAPSASPPLAGAYALAAVPARYALERGAWAEAARLEVVKSRYAFTEAITWFAKGLGAGRMKDVAGARAAAAALDQAHRDLAAAGEEYWSEQVKIQLLGVSAWLRLAEGYNDEALSLLREAADAEDKTEKASVTPGPIAPAREMLGDMLAELGHPAAALAAYDTTLKKEPNRLRALIGAVNAANASSDKAAAARHMKTLAAVAAKADPGRPELSALKAETR
jgi:tetratricopeptide (TPR) repeat protein